MAAVPLAILSTIPRMAKASTATLIETLNVALTLEHLEYRYYQMALEAGVIDGPDRNIFMKIRDHELAQVKFLVLSMWMSLSQGGDISLFFKFKMD